MHRLQRQISPARVAPLCSGRLPAVARSGGICIRARRLSVRQASLLGAGDCTWGLFEGISSTPRTFPGTLGGELRSSAGRVYRYAMGPDAWRRAHRGCFHDASSGPELARAAGAICARWESSRWVFSRWEPWRGRTGRGRTRLGQLRGWRSQRSSRERMEASGAMVWPFWAGAALGKITLRGFAGPSVKLGRGVVVFYRGAPKQRGEYAR